MNKTHLGFQGSHGVAKSMERETDLRDEIKDTHRETTWQTTLIATHWACFTISPRADSSYKTDARIAIMVGIVIMCKAQLLEPLSDFSVISNQ